MGFDNELMEVGLGLGLGLGFPSSTVDPRIRREKIHEEPSLTLCLSGETFQVNNQKVEYSAGGDLHRQDSAASSFSNVSVKREREIGSSTDQEADERISSSRIISDEDDDGSNAKKKLRLTKVQSALLEQSFKLQSTLNTKQKQDLARELKLRPRQVEVWFQNRRARTKLKQTEVDCEFLKKCCETLTDENRRLHKELQELKALKPPAQPFYMQLPAATLSMCPSCERIADGAGAENAPKSSFAMAPKPHYFNPFTKPSAAC